MTGFLTSSFALLLSVLVGQPAGAQNETVERLIAETTVAQLKLRDVLRINKTAVFSVPGATGSVSGSMFGFTGRYDSSSNFQQTSPEKGDVYLIEIGDDSVQGLLLKLNEAIANPGGDPISEGIQFTARFLSRLVKPGEEKHKINEVLTFRQSIIAGLNRLQTLPLTDSQSATVTLLVQWARNTVVIVRTVSLGRVEVCDGRTWRGYFFSRCGRDAFTVILHEYNIFSSSRARYALDRLLYHDEVIALY